MILQNQKRIFTAQYVRRDKAKTVIAILASIYFIYVALTPGNWVFLNYVNLVFHEAGHFLFIPFGYFLTIAGGTILQLLVPAVLAGYFFARRSYFAASLLLFWLGQSFLDVHVYAADALVMKLPLLGGDDTGHDWNIMLAYTGLLRETDAIALTIRVIGTAIILFAIYASIKTAVKKEETQN